MDDNQKRFIEDALDLLNELDEGLLQLEANPQSSAPLEQVFRTMHTIKGGASMFGFDNIGELAHHLETLYDLVRQKKMQVTDGLISITLHAFDKVRDLLKEKDVKKIADAESLKDHLSIAIQFLSSADVKDADQIVGSTKDELGTFLIQVIPTVSITADGNHPLVFIIQDLAALGHAKVFCHKKESGEVTQWDVFLCTTTGQNEIESYFIFVENECQVNYTKLLAYDLFELPEFSQYIDQFEAVPVELNALKEFVNQITANLTLEADIADGDELQATGNKKSAHNDTYIKVNKRKIDDLLNWISELIILQTQLVNASESIHSSELNAVTEQLGMTTNRLRDTSLEIGLVPIETLVTKFKRVVRDLSKGLQKKVNFLSEGAETEIDKDVIELIAEPMIHIIRNSIDHGIEKPEERKKVGKSEHGTVKLKAFNSSSYVNIVISDDGKGINKESVLMKAIEKGIVTPDAILDEEETLNLIFHPGLSTASQITDVSGRGVGMDVVKQRISDLRGFVTVKSTIGKGTAIHIKLPLSRSIIEGMLVRVGENRYVVPLNVIDHIDRIPFDMLSRENSVNKTVVVNGEPLAVLSLRQKFDLHTQAPKTIDIISVSANGVKKGIAVDRIEGKMHTVMKPLGDAYRQQDFIAGSTILGNGSLALVLDPSRLLSH